MGSSSWARVPALPTPPPPPAPDSPCVFAEELATSCQRLLEQLHRHAPRHSGEGDVTLRWVKAALLDHFADVLVDTPPGHTNPTGEEIHRCIADIFIETVTAIRHFQRSLPPPPPPPPVVIPPSLLPQQVSGLFYQE